MDPARNKRLFASITRTGFPVPVTVGAEVITGTRTHLKADLAASLYGFEDRYACSVLIPTPAAVPGKGDTVTLAGATYVIIGVQLFAGDISCRLDLRENF